MCSGGTDVSMHQCGGNSGSGGRLEVVVDNVSSVGNKQSHVSQSLK